MLLRWRGWLAEPLAAAASRLNESFSLPPQAGCSWTGTGSGTSRDLPPGAPPHLPPSLRPSWCRRYKLPPTFCLPPGIDDCLVHFFCFYCASQ
jgi:hypothetical protein